MHLHQWIAYWPVAFAVTLVVEVPIFMKLAPAELPRWRAAVAGAAGSCVTHPLLWFVWVPSIRGYTLAVVTGELLVVVIESTMFFLLTQRRSWRRAVAAACLANAASFGVGLLVQLSRC